jgi:uncharacterized protein (TIGR03790 family)
MKRQHLPGMGWNTRRARAVGIRLATLLGLAACGGGGGSGEAPSPTPPAAPAPTLGPAQLALLVAEGDATSEAIARAYAAARGVPEANIVRLPVPQGGAVLSAAQFNGLKSTLDARLGADIQATLVTWAQPSRVQGSCSMSLTSALALGYDASYCSPPTNVCAATTPSRYYDTSTRRPWTDLGLRPSMMLGAATLAEAQTLIARGLAADASWLGATPASGQALLVRTSDAQRSVRYTDFLSLPANPAARLTRNYIDNSSGQGSDFVVGETGVMFYFTGLLSVPGIDTLGWLPGAVADHLTSLGGLTEPNAPSLGQMPATAWLRAGATGSYGTVEEPCNLADKFPRASVLMRRYSSGDTLIEAYWKSVRTPGQGLFLGEPLARPWATR